MSGAVGKTWEDVTGQSASEDIGRAAETQAASQEAALEAYKEAEAVPQAFREAGYQRFGEMFGIGYDPETGQTFATEPTLANQQQLVEQAMASPMYGAVMGTREAGEEALARQMAAGGAGLRGGSTTSALIDYNTQLANQALMSGYSEAVRQQQQQLGGIQTLMGTPSTAGNIAQMQAGIGQTLAQGQIAGAQAQQQAMGGLIGAGTTLGAAAIMSDARLKEDILLLGPTTDPRIFKYEWTWGDKAESMGKKGKEKGYLAHEVQSVWPDLVIEGPDGYKRILKEQVEQRLKELN